MPEIYFEPSDIPTQEPVGEMPPVGVQEFDIVRPAAVAEPVAEVAQEVPIVASEERRRVPVQTMEAPASPEVHEEAMPAEDLARCQQIAAATGVSLDDVKELYKFDRILPDRLSYSLDGKPGVATVDDYRAAADALRRIPPELCVVL